jgi:serine phosphatase RsbU (regulator of sigma subunit)
MQTVALHAGDTLCVVTDGVTEAMNSAGDCYGTRRLEAALEKSAGLGNPHALISNIREDVAAFVSGAEASDDMTLLVLHWKGPENLPV